MFSIKEFFSKCDQIRKKNADLVTFNKEIFNGKLHFLCNASCKLVHGSLDIMQSQATLLILLTLLARSMVQTSLFKTFANNKVAQNLNKS